MTIGVLNEHNTFEFYLFMSIFSFFLFFPEKLTFRKQILTFRAWPTPETPEGNIINYQLRVHGYFSVPFFIHFYIYTYSYIWYLSFFYSFPVNMIRIPIEYALS